MRKTYTSSQLPPERFQKGTLWCGQFLLKKLCLLVAFVAMTQMAMGAIINVPADQPTIAAAAGVALDGDEIVVANGSHAGVNFSAAPANTAPANITIRAANPGGATITSGSILSGMRNITIADFVVQGLISASGLDGRMIVQNCTFSGFNTAAISVINSTNKTQVSLLNNVFDINIGSNNEDLIRITTSGSDPVDILIDGNTNKSGGTYSTLLDQAIFIDLVSGNTTAVVVITNNDFGGWANSGNGIDLRAGDGSTSNLQIRLLVEGNTFDGPVDASGMNLVWDGTGTVIEGVINNNQIIGSTISGDETDEGFYFTATSNASGVITTFFVTNNTISNVTDAGVRFRAFNTNTTNNHDLVVDNNTMNNVNVASTEAAVHIDSGSGGNYSVEVEVTNNTITNLTTNCVRVEETAGAIVRYLISGNTDDGMACNTPNTTGAPEAVADPVPASAALGSIGDFVWNDVNQDGDQDGGAEVGVGGVTINFSGGGFSGSTSTNASGNYSIPALPAGTYTLTIVPTSLLSFVTNKDAGGNDNLDSDFDPTTKQVSVTLTAGQNNNTVDGGLTGTEPVSCTIANSTCPADITVSNTPGQCNAVVNIPDPTIPDDCGSATFSYAPASGSSFSVGTTQVTATISDGNGGQTTCTLDVTVNDTEAPTIACPGNIAVSNDPGQCGARILEYVLAPGDNCPGFTVDQTSGFSVGSVFPVGTTTNTFVITDASGNTGSCSFDITVIDTEAPTITCPSPSTTKNVTVQLVDALNVSTYNWAIKDAGNNTVASGSKSGLGTEQFPATLNCGANYTIDITIPGPNPPAPLANLQVIIDNVSVVNQSSVGSGASFSFAVPSCGAGDFGGSAAAGTCALTVNGLTPTPTDNCPGVTYTYTLTGATTGSGNGDASGTSFNVGTTTVTYTPTDASGNTGATCSLDVVVTDDEAPNAVCEDVTVTLDNGGNASITTGDINNGSTDNCSLASLGLNMSSFECEDIGANSVTLTVADINGNTASCNATVTVNGSQGCCGAGYIWNPATQQCEDIDECAEGTSNCPPGTICVNTPGSFVCVPTCEITNSTCPADITVSNDPGNCSAVVNIPDPTIPDDCGSATFSYAPASGSTFPVGTTEVTATISDGNGGQTTCTLDVTVNDDEAPTAVCQNITVQLDGGGNASITASDVNNGSSDNCGLAAISVSPNTFNCSNIGGNTVTLSVTDINGNVSTCTANVRVEDNVAPVAVCQDITIQLDGGGNASITPGDVDGGSTDNCGLAALSVSPNTFNCSNVGGNSVTLFITDVYGNVSTCTANVTVEDNVAPVALCADITVQLDATGNASITADDVDGGSSDACGIADLSADLTTFDCSNVGGNTVTLTVTDDNGNQSTCTANVTVEDNVPPVALCADITVQLDATGNASITADDVDGGSSDACGIADLSADLTTFDCSNVGGNTVTLTVTDDNGNQSTCTANVTVEDNVPPVALCADITVQLDATGNANITADDVDGGSSDACGIADLSADLTTFDCSNVGGNTVTLTVTDDNGNQSTCTANVTVEDNVPPVALCADITVQLDATGNANITADDVDGGSSDACGIADLSADLTTFDCSNVGGNTVTLTVTDDNGNQSTCTANVTVEDNVPPVALCADITVQLDATGNASITADDVDGGSSDACGIADLSADLTTFDCSNVGGNTVTLTVTDDNGNQSTCTANVTVEDNVPPVALCADITVQLDATGNASITADDVDGGSSDACGIADLSADLTTFDCSNVGGNTVTLTVTDDNGNQSTCTANVTVEDNIAPVAACNDITIDLVDENTYNLSQSDIDAIATGTSDNCAGVTYDITGGTTAYDCDDAGMSFQITLTATDASGNTDICQAQVTVEDPNSVCNAAPTAVCMDITVDADANCQGSAVAEDFDGGSTDPDGDDLSFSIDVMGPYSIGVTNVVLTVSDPDGLSDQCNATITVEDNTNPVPICPADIEVDNDPGVCGAIVTFEADATDNCPGVTFEASPASGSFFDVGTTQVTVTATDAVGNTASCSFDVTVNDTEDPILSGVPGDVTVSCDAIPTPPTVTADDNCSPTPTVNFVEYQSKGVIPTNGLVGFWPFDEGSGTNTAEMVNGNDGTLSANVSWISDQLSGNAVQFPGVGNHYVQAPNTTNGDLDTRYSLSMFAWYKPGTSGPKQMPIINYATASQSFPGPHIWQVGATSLFVRFVRRNGAYLTPQSANVLIPGQWNLVGATYDYNTGIATLWHNGVAVATQNVGVYEMGTQHTVRMGSLNTDGRRTNGAIDNALIYDRALTSGEVMAMYNAGCPQNYVITRTWSAEDASGNEVSQSQVITVEDNTPPVVSCPANITVDNDPGMCNAVVSFAATATDNCSNNIDIGYSTNSGSTFPVGTTQVTVTATDECGNESQCTFDVTVNDTENPVPSCPADLVVGNDPGECGAIVNYPFPEAMDNCQVVELQANPISGSFFPTGINQVVVTATDNSGNTAECSFNVTVEDREPPVVECQELTFCNVLGEEITITPADVITSLTDNCSAPGNITTVLSQTVFTDADLGENMVTVTATDEAGQEGTCETSVHLVGFGAAVAGDQSECDPFTNTYRQTLEITYATAPGYSGNIVVNDQVFEATGSPQTVTLVDLISDGQPVDVLVSFEGQYACPQAFEDIFTAPQDCSVRCDISDITVGNAHDCDEEAGTYQQDIFLHYQGTNLTGFILVEIDGDNNFTPYPIENMSPQKITLTLPLDGQEHSVFVKFSDDQGCSFRAERLFRALHMCGCDIVGMDLFQEPTCNTDGTYDVCFFVEGFNIATSGGMLQINGQMVDYSAEPVIGGIVVCASNIPGNGERGVDVFFKAEDNCTWTARDLYDAPFCDPDACMIDGLTVLNATCTDPDPTYDLQLEVTHHNAPNSGTLDIEINGITYNFPIMASPQVVNVFGLPATGAPVDVTAKFSDDRDCELRVEGLYDAPDCGFPCLISDIALAGNPICEGDGEGATYSVDVIVTYENAPPTGSLRVSINGTHTDVEITGSPQIVTVEGLVPGGLPTDVTASFTDNDNCQRTEPDMFVSPECGIAQPCDLYDIQLRSLSECNEDTETYDVCFDLTGIRLPENNTDPAFRVIVGGQEISPVWYQMQTNEAGTEMLLCIYGIEADGREKDVFIQVADGCSKYVRRLYEAPMCESDEDEDDDCDILSIEATQSYCDGDGTYTQRFELRYNDAPATGQIALEINGEWRNYDITSSPQTIIVPGLRADGRYVRVFAKFTDVDGCTIYERNLYRAPSDCRANRMAGTQREISIFPNPSSGKFQIMATADSYNQADVKVFNKLGQLVKEMEITENTQAVLDLTDQPEGIYTVRIMGDAYVVTQKVQVVK